MGSTSGFTDFTRRLGFICCCWRLSLQPEGEGPESSHFPCPAWSLDAWEYIGASQSCLWSSTSKLPATLLFALTCIMALGSWVQLAECRGWLGGVLWSDPRPAERSITSSVSGHYAPRMSTFPGSHKCRHNSVCVWGWGFHEAHCACAPSPRLPVPDPGSLMLRICSLPGGQFPPHPGYCFTGALTWSTVFVPPYMCSIRGRAGVPTSSPGHSGSPV